jgi:hypothetical protein
VYTWFWWGNLRERDHLEDASINESITLQWIFKKWGGEAWTGLIWLRIGTCGRQFCGKEPTDSVTLREFLD